MFAPLQLVYLDHNRAKVTDASELAATFFCLRHRITVRKTAIMPAINNAIVARDTYSTIAKRNWASEEPGVIVVFCIVFVVGCGLVGLWISKCLARRRASKAQVV